MQESSGRGGPDQSSFLGGRSAIGFDHAQKLEGKPRRLTRQFTGAFGRVRACVQAFSRTRGVRRTGARDTIPRRRGVVQPSTGGDRAARLAGAGPGRRRRSPPSQCPIRTPTPAGTGPRPGGPAALPLPLAAPPPRWLIAARTRARASGVAVGRGERRSYVQVHRAQRTCPAPQPSPSQIPDAQSAPAVHAVPAAPRRDRRAAARAGRDRSAAGSPAQSSAPALPRRFCGGHAINAAPPRRSMLRRQAVRTPRFIPVGSAMGAAFGHLFRVTTFRRVHGPGSAWSSTAAAADRARGRGHQRELDRRRPQGRAGQPAPRGRPGRDRVRRARRPHARHADRDAGAQPRRPRQVTASSRPSTGRRTRTTPTTPSSGSAPSPAAGARARARPSAGSRRARWRERSSVRSAS